MGLGYNHLHRCGHYCLILYVNLCQCHQQVSRPIRLRVDQVSTRGVKSKPN